MAGHNQRNCTALWTSPLAFCQASRLSLAGPDETLRGVTLSSAFPYGGREGGMIAAPFPSPSAPDFSCLITPHQIPLFCFNADIDHR